MRKISIIMLVLLVLIPSVSALQQTIGAVNISVEPGNSVISKYKITNEENKSVDIKFNVTGEISEFVSYEKNITLESKESRYINVTIKIPNDYSGENKLGGTIYALNEGRSGNQVQVNVRLGKNINLEVNKPKNDNIIIILSLILMCVVVFGYAIIKWKKLNSGEIK
jgi:hypothetical protein